MIKILAAMATTILLLIPVMSSAGNYDTPGTYDPPVVNLNPPEVVQPFTWSGAYAGATAGKSEHTRTYTRDGVRHWNEEVTHTEHEKWEKHQYTCERGEHDHFGPKCDVTGLTHSPEIGALSFAHSPWNNNRDETVRYSSNYDGVWLGADETFSFSLPDYVEARNRGGNWATLTYEHLSGVTATQWTEVIERSEAYSEEYEVTHHDTTFGFVSGYRYQFEGTPFVVGGEINVFETQDLGETFTQIGLQGGLALERNLTFAEVGAEHFAVGNDYALGNEGNFVVGVRYWEQDEVDGGTMLRGIYKF